MNEALWCNRDALTYKSYSSDIREHEGVVSDPNKNYIIIISTKTVIHIAITIFVKILAIGVCLHIVQPYHPLLSKANWMPPAWQTNFAPSWRTLCSIWQLKRRMLPAGVGGDQNRTKSRVNTEL